MSWELIDKIKSQLDNTVKYVFKQDSYVVEFSYINKNDGKDIICVPTQTSCNMGCSFCHLTGLNLKVINLKALEIAVMVSEILSDIQIKQNVLLISYMGAGEPLRNIEGLIASADFIKTKFSSEYEVVRFAIASIIPSKDLMKQFMKQVKDKNLNFKFHLSLHNIEENERKSLMPRALNIRDSIDLLSEYSKNIGKTEVHYTLINDVNDSAEKARILAQSLKGINTTVKLLKFSPKFDSPMEASLNENNFIKELNNFNIMTEIYCPPGRDIGSSCGQFNVASYIK